VFLTRWPEEPADEVLSEFYKALLIEIRSPVFRTGEWQLLTCSGWADNDSSRHMVACSWTHGADRRVVVVNLADVRAQARVTLPWADLGDHDWQMADVLTGERFYRAGGDLLHGLYVDLPGWQVHWLNVTAA
jgi:hypothetical protein